MWSKDEQQDQAPSPTPSSAPRRGSEQTRIGSSVAMEGKLKCEEDLRLEGKFKGTVSAPNHRVVIGTGGRLRANVQARVIEVEGQVVGDLVGLERVVVKASGNVSGNLVAPRVSLENGAQFKGSIDMDAAGAASESPRKNPKSSAAQPASSASGAKATASVS